MALLSTGHNPSTTFSEKKAVHGLTREDDGLLKYTRVYLSSDESFQVSDGSGFAYGGLDDIALNLTNDGTAVNTTVKNTAEAGLESWQNDKTTRQYEQIRMDDNQLSYYMNEDGFLVARYNADYPYANSNGAVRNWKA